MEKHFEDLAQIRKNLISYLMAYDVKRLSYIPMGFKNNIFWNCAHVLVTQQLMTYYLTDNEMLVDNDWVMRYKKGTFGDPNATEDDVHKLIKLLQSTQVRLKKDYFDEELAYFRPYETSFGIKLETIEDAIRFNNLHESLHLGYVMALSKSIS
ncbi:DinB family protein [Moheibacter stercoris]|uniref:DinB-like domain-containing protein n=1 Tax=Moheibacter stercoris TaxID=1628251 RepID=A0ABV2LR82_9FLAO